MLQRIRIIAFVFGFLALSLYAQDSTLVKYKLGFFDLTGGLDTRLNVGHPGKYQDPTDPYSQVTIFHQTKASFYQGAFFRMQTSFFGTYYKQKFKKLLFGDLISAEVSAGYSDATLTNLKSGFQILYNFEFGFFGMYRLSENTDIGMSFSLLKFSRDYLSDLDSGSDYYFRVRHRRFLAELGYLSKNKMYFGVFNFVAKSDNQDKLSIGLKYFIQKNRIIGARIEMVPLSGKLYIGDSQQSAYSLKLFYGVNF
jgi:hypothetical protein